MNRNSSTSPIAMTTFDALTRRSAAALIAGYQQHLSPRKGFECAYRLLHGGESCSQYIKRTILEVGLIEAVRASRHRLQACKSASLVLKSQMETQEDPEKDSERRRDSSEDNSSSQCPITPLDFPTAGCEAIDCGGSAWEGCAGWHGIDCGAMDCGAADCSVLDCASCGG
jgi:putative component of membrane protein insertase Oxa1/YidC/SpoIIIJ protein YidD